MGEFDHSTEVQRLLDRLRAGDPDARAALLAYTFERLRRLAHRMFRREADLRALLDTDDVLQGAAVRLHRALPEVQPDTVRRFFALAAQQIRRELIDLARRHLGSDRVRTSPAASPGGAATTGHQPLEEAKAPEGEPASLAEWSDLHEKVEGLPPEEREVFDLLWYQDLTQAEAAQLLGVSLRTIKRRWRVARLLLHAALHGDWPGT
jgi:RNA polymerase sigma factor (sigma-70 family)